MTKIDVNAFRSVHDFNDYYDDDDDGYIIWIDKNVKEFELNLANAIVYCSFDSVMIGDSIIKRNFKRKKINNYNKGFQQIR
ncbi:hypothetical protein DERP_015052 [Dermatophagoides pteronyssinus]|uniref:Uncharacterized protein n=1 Tax=Dermatophagoides pteronyssinus TaxID=6956 RepID=A0ABQ8J5S5_DERPT|nr:hypothetical protein DERP_015052 [Dermatophagoides pteronyssinus]